MTSTSDPSSTSAEEVLERVHRAEWGRLVSMLLARTRRLDLVEDAVAEAFARAALRWPADGIPSNPAGWLYAVAHRNVIGRLRAEAIAARHAPLLAVRPGDTAPQDGLDERLHLVLLCCHPALGEASRPALALRLVIGTPTEQIARLFLVSTATMAARLTRAKQKIVAVAEASGPVAGLSVLVGLGEVLSDDHRLASVQADLLRRAGHLGEAATAYRTAIEQCTNDVERVHLLERVAALGSSTPHH